MPCRYKGAGAKFEEKPSMKEILAQLSAIADGLDEIGAHSEADDVTSLMLVLSKKKLHKEDSHDGKGIPQDPHGQPGYDDGSDDGNGGADGGGDGGGD